MPDESPPAGRVLVVDDEREIVALLCDILSFHGYRATGVSEGDAALQALRDQPFDVLLTDLMMPGIDGITLLKAALDIDPDVVGIVITGQGTVESAVGAMKSGAFDYLMKPFRTNEIVPLLARAMEVRRLRVENIQLRETVAILELAPAISRTLDPARVLDEVVDAAVRQCRADEASILVPAPDRESLEVAVVRGERRAVVQGNRMPLGAGISGFVARSLESVSLEGEVHDARFVPGFPRSDIRYAVSTPMVSGGRLAGVLNVALTREARPFTPGHRKALQVLADVGAAALENARLYREAGTHVARLQALRSIDQAITSSLDLHLTLSVLLENVVTHLEVDGATVLLLDPATQSYRPAASRGVVTPSLARTAVRLGEGPVGLAARERRVVGGPDAEAAARDCPRCRLLGEEGFRWCVAAPLVSKGAVKGVLEVLRRAPGDRDAEWQDFLEALAGQAAIAVDNAALYTDLMRSNEELATAYETTLEGWSQALDLRDRETEGHSRRVAEMTVRLAEALGAKGQDLVNVRRGALLHDIGKLGIPDAILHKNGPLDEAEWEVMRRHPGYARDMLMRIPFLRGAVDIPYGHHERWDGSGYPRGLKGDQIPLSARIFAVVDVWDALRFDRPYRAARPEDEVRLYLQENAGLRFDPDVVACFLSMDW